MWNINKSVPFSLWCMWWFLRRLSSKLIPKIITSPNILIFQLISTKIMKLFWSNYDFILINLWIYSQSLRICIFSLILFQNGIKVNRLLLPLSALLSWDIFKSFLMSYCDSATSCRQTHTHTQTVSHRPPVRSCGSHVILANAQRDRKMRKGEGGKCSSVARRFKPRWWAHGDTLMRAHSASGP